MGVPVGGDNKNGRGFRRKLLLPGIEEVPRRD